MFNLTGSEIIFLLIIGLVVLGPEKLPDAIRRVGRLYAELKRMSSGVQTDFRKIMDEPIKEMMSTTNSVKAIFNETASQFQSVSNEIADPKFVPFETEKITGEVNPIVLYDAETDSEKESCVEIEQKSEVDTKLDQQLDLPSETISLDDVS